MSYGSLGNNPNLGRVVTKKDSVEAFIYGAWQNRFKTYTSVDRIISAKDGETWASLIVRSLLDTLHYDSSLMGDFGTPDDALVRGASLSGAGKNLWVKLLGIKMDILLCMLDSLPEISSTQKDRIRGIDAEFRKIFPSKEKGTTPSPDSLSP